ncbi:MAG: hypothetical protein IT210_11770 [Armatimonadetes bacterium]|nr:hypothetical protein [Armatimonadota bacterium]
MDTDQPLQTPLTLHLKMTPLAEFLARVSQQCAISLQADKAIADDKVTAIVKHKPAWEVLTKVSALLDLSWEKTEAGYRLYQTQEARRQEHSLRQAYQQDRRKEAQERLQALMATSQTDFDVLGQEDSDSTYAYSAASDDRQQPKAFTFGIRSHPPNGLPLHHYLAGWALRHATPGQWKRLWRGVPLIASTDPQRDLLPLPSRLHEWQQTERLRQTQFLQSVHPNVKIDTRLPPPSAECLYLILRLSPDDRWLDIVTWKDEGPRLHCQEATGVGLTSCVGRPQDSILSEHPGYGRWLQWETPPSQMLDNPALQQPLRQGNQKAGDLHLEPHGAIRATPSERLEWLADHSDLSIIADAFRVHSFAVQFARVRQMDHFRPPSLMVPEWDAATPAQWLEQYTRDQVDGFVRVEGDYVLFRHLHYWQLRPSEVPERLLRPLERTARQTEVLDLADFEDLATHITPAQEIALSAQSGRYHLPFDARMLDGNIPALRFWASLNSHQQQRALRKIPISWAELTARQQRLFGKALDGGHWWQTALLFTSETVNMVAHLSEPVVCADLSFYCEEHVFSMPDGPLHRGVTLTFGKPYIAYLSANQYSLPLTRPNLI